MEIRVAICGIDGAGKTQLIDGLYSYYQKIGLSVEKTKVSFGCKDICKEASVNNFPSIIRVGMAFDFVNHYNEIKSECQLLLCDRYDVCYRVLNRVDLKDSTVIEALDNIYSTIPDADLYVLLDLPAEESASRLDLRGNRAENESLEILNSMRRYYNTELKKKKNVFVVDATKSSIDVFKTVTNIIDKIIGVQL